MRETSTSKLINKLIKKEGWRGVIEIYSTVRPLDPKTALAFYTAPLKWLSALGRKRLLRLVEESLNREYLLINSKHGNFIIRKEYFLTFIWENHEINIISGLLKNDSTFVDVGAFLGLYTVVACRRVKKVIAVEPNPYNLAFLKANISLNKCSNVSVVNKAVASHKGFAELKIPKGFEERKILGVSAENTFISPLGSIARDFAGHSITVETDTLDNIVDEAGVERVDVVKIDIEGAEGMAFEGMRNTLRKAKAVMIEICCPENQWKNIWIVKEMKKMGYKITNAIDNNIIFIKSP